MERPRGERAAARGEGGEGGGEDPPPRQLRRPRAGVRAAPRRARVVVLERDAARPNLRPDVRARPPPERARHCARLRRAPPRGPLRGSRHHRPRGEERRRGALGVHRGRRPGRPVRGDLDPSRRGRPLGNLAGGPSRPRRGPIAPRAPSDDPLDGIDADARCVRLTATGGESVGLAAEALALVHASRRVREGGRSVVWDFSAASATCPCQDEDPLDPLDPLDDDEEDYPGARGARRLLLAQNKNPTPTRARATAKAKAKATTTAATATPPSLCAAGNLHPDARIPGWSALFDSSTVAPPSRERALARGDRKSSSGTSSRVSAWLGAVARVVGLGARRTPSSRRASTSTTPTPSSTSRTHPSSTRPSRGSAGPATAPPPPTPPPLRRCVRRGFRA